jgi:ketosteroid isomerase-like protein
MSQENVDVVRAAIDAWSGGNESAALEHVDPDVEVIPRRSATDGTFRGHEGIERFWADTLENFDEFEPSFEFRDLGESVLAWGTIHVRGRASGVEMDVPTGGIFDFRDGKIVRWEDFGSKDKALEAAGLRE